jgi:hypothetical protein
LRGLAGRVVVRGEAEVNKFNHDLAIIFVLIYQKVLQFYIPVNYLFLVDVIYRGNHVIKNAAAVWLFDRCIDLYHQVSHVTEHEVHYDVDVLIVLVEVIELGNARMLHGWHYFFFSVNRLQLPHLQFLLTVYFDCYIFAGFFVIRFVNIGLAALADYLFDGVSVFERHFFGFLYFLWAFDRLDDGRRLKLNLI